MVQEGGVKAQDSRLLAAVLGGGGGEYTPYLVGFAFHDEEQAEKAFFQWQSAGLPVITWPDLPPEVLAQKERHRDALLLRKTRIYLPVHQSIEHDQITNCVGSL